MNNKCPIAYSEDGDEDCDEYGADLPSNNESHQEKSNNIDFNNPIL